VDRVEISIKVVKVIKVDKAIKADPTNQTNKGKPGTKNQKTIQNVEPHHQTNPNAVPILHQTNLHPTINQIKVVVNLLDPLVNGINAGPQ